MIIAFLVMVISRQATKLPVSFFSEQLFQLTLAVLSALLLSTALFIALYRSIVRPGWQGCVRVAGLVLIYGGLVFAKMYVGSILWKIDTMNKVAEARSSDRATAPKWATEHADPREREAAARLHYLLTGTAVTYRTADGASRVYEPTAEDVAICQEWKVNTERARENNERIDWFAKNWQWQTWIYLGTLAATFLVGPVVVLVRERRRVGDR